MDVFGTAGRGEDTEGVGDVHLTDELIKYMVGGPVHQEPVLGMCRCMDVGFCASVALCCSATLI